MTANETADSASDSIDEGMRLLEKADYSGAEAAFREAIRIDHASAEAHQGLGWTLLGLDRNLEAGAAFKSAVRLDPEAAGSHEGLGHVLMREERYAAAEAAYREAIALDPGNSGVHMGLGDALWEANRYPEAESEFREATRIDPSDAGAHRGLGRVLSQLGRYSEAEAEFRVAVSLDPGNAEAERDLSEMERDIQDLGEAEYHRLTAFERWERARRDKPGPQTLRGYPHARAGRRFMAGLIDDYMIPATALMAYDYWFLAVPVALYFLNGYVEGRTGQSFGKALAGLYTVSAKTGEFIGGGKGSVRRLLHVADYILVVGWLAGLVTGQTFADSLAGTVVVSRPY